jgi:hypothetical protein
MNRLRGSAMPMVLGCTTVAMIVAAIAWDRAASRRHAANHQAYVWQAELAAEAGLASSLHLIASPSDSADSLMRHASFWLDSRSHYVADPGEAGLYPTARSTGYAREGSGEISRTLRVVWGKRPDAVMFGAALTLFDPNSTPSSSLDVRGEVRVPLNVSISSGRKALPTGLAVMQYVPSGVARDTVAAPALYQEHLRSTDAILGGGRWDAAHLPPAGDSDIVYTLGDLEISAPENGTRWSPGKGRRVFVEGRLDIHGAVDLRGWSFYAKGPVVLDGSARLEGFLWSTLPVRLDGNSRFQGELVARTRFTAAGDAQVTSPTAILIKGSLATADTGCLFQLLDRSRVEAYAMAQYHTSSIEIGTQAEFTGVAIANNLRNSGKLYGCGVGLRAEGTGKFDRSRLPADFAVPVGIGTSSGIVVIRRVLE